MADAKIPRDHSNAGRARARGYRGHRGRGRGGPAGARPNVDLHPVQDLGLQQSAPNHTDGDSAAVGNGSERGRGRGKGRGRGGLQPHGRGLGPQSTTSNRGNSYHNGRNTELNNDNNHPTRNSGRSAISNGFNRSKQRIPSELSADQIKDFLQTGLDAINTSAEARQDFVNRLATEDGLLRVKQIVETSFSLSYSVTEPMFDPHCILFLRIISHDEIESSLLLEKATGTIYNVVYGHDGNRGIAFFEQTAQYLRQMMSEAVEENGQMNKDEVLQFEEALFLTAKALLNTLKINQGAAIKKEFKRITEQLSICCHVENIDHDLASLNLRSTYDTIIKIKRRLAIGDAFSATNIENTRTGGAARQRRPDRIPAEIEVDFPGELSRFGSRHDNDHALISKIEILPTVSEILSDGRADFLPARPSSNVPSKHHQTGLLRLLDSQFRLLREDTSGLLRDTVRMILDNWKTLVHNPDWSVKRKILRNQSATPVRIYFDAQIQLVKSDWKKGVEIEVEFDQTRGARNPHLARRKQWWRESRALKEGGTILALIYGEEEENVIVIFLQVSAREICLLNPDGQHNNPSGTRRVRDLASDTQRAMTTLKLANATSKTDLSNLLHLVSDKTSRPLILVEFPAVLYNSFEGILRRLQSLHKDPADIPFTNWLAPSVQDHELAENTGRAYVSGKTTVPPPSYLRNNTLIDLSSIPTITNSANSTTVTPLTMLLAYDPRTLSTYLSETTTLDSGQATAMISALRHEVALIQGPPGTGKSYVGIQIAKCLLNNRDALDLGPILCVCYTNHALDQFLNELLDSGVTSILRVGTRSQFPHLEALSIDNYSKNGQIPKIPGTGKKIAESRARLELLKVEIQDVCGKIEGSTPEMVKKFLEQRFSVQAKAIFGDRSASAQSNLESVHHAEVETWVTGDAPGDWSNTDVERSLDQLLREDVWTLKKLERRRLYKYWCETALAELSQRFHDLMQMHSAEKQSHTSLFNNSQAQFIKQFHVVGVTTTGLANNAELLRTLPSRVLICEEAGEVLEAHVLTVLLPSIQHAILIGDHQQLRPRISNLKLSMEYDRTGPKYNLDESLFERLANSRFESLSLNGEDGRFPVMKLDHQRRMHPAISTLIRETLYPHLLDHPNTNSYPEVPGMKRRLFWLDHRNFEDAGNPDEPMQSRTNTWEAKMVTALVRHLCRQGRYKPGEIAVLTPYVGQLRILKDMLDELAELIIGERDLEDLATADIEVVRRDNHGQRGRAPGPPQRQHVVEKGTLLDELRLATVDNFQGEEATIVIVSLVRSNTNQNCGFLKTPNRINVLLSRAKHGMYIIGNANTSSHVPMWSSVIKVLEKGRNIGPKLELHCSRHPSNKYFVSSAESFAIQAPEGGCAEMCGLRLICGHSCTVKCHSPALHGAVKCAELCIKVRDCGHACSRLCSTLCGECPERIPNVGLPCGHMAKEVGCHQMGNLADVRCDELVEKKMPRCSHYTKLRCSKRTSISTIRCENLCGSLLPCGHSCRNPCWKCTDTGDHGSCNTPCGRSFTTCAHNCSQPCHSPTPCLPCDRPCEIRCKHSKCPLKCSDPCPPCAEPCEWSCEHRHDSCSMPCAIPCDIVPCDHRCEKMLRPCGHQCPGICGEICPDSKFCQICCAPDIRDRTADWLTLENYGEIKVDDDPIIFLSCGHFCTVSNFDGIMELPQHYDTDPLTGKIIRPKLSRRVVVPGAVVKGCPECRMPLRDVHRYNRIVKKALLDEATRRFVAQANMRAAELLEEIHNREIEIDSERTAFIQEWSEPGVEDRDSDRIRISVGEYRAQNTRLQRKVDKFTKSVKKTEQPFGKVNDMFTSAVARQQNIKANAFEVDESIIQTGFQFRGECYSLRLSWASLWDFDAIYTNNAIDSRIRLALRNIVASQVKVLVGKSLSLVEASRNARFPQQQVEALIYHALFSMLSFSNAQPQGQPVDAAAHQSVKALATKSLDECETLLSQYSGTLGYLKDDIEKARRLVNGGTFYSFVTTEEKREVYRAMAEQFSGTGHWYYCRNNHPFTVGECGMPMEEARCPQCNEPIGGLDHTPVQGVLRAEDLEAEFGA